jgi:hypothetical protein
MVKYTDVTQELFPVMLGLKKKYRKYIGHIDLSKIRIVTAVYSKQYEFYAIVRYFHPAVKVFMKEDIDYILEICLPNSKKFNRDQIFVLLLHELMHIPKGGTDPKSANYLSIADHDIEEFSQIMSLTVNFLDWAKDNTKIMNILSDSSVKDIKISSSGKVKIYE